MLRFQFANSLFSIIVAVIAVETVFPNRLLAQPPEIVRAEAWTGTPFGVGKVSFRTGQEGRLVHNTHGLLIDDLENRLFYPAYTDGLLSMVMDKPVVGGMQTVWFLFRGDQPMTITLRCADTATFTVIPSARRPAIGRIAFQSWWRQFQSQKSKRTEAGDYPPLIESYLTSMLQRRLNLEPPIFQRLAPSRNDQLQQTVNLLFDVESIRAESIRDLMTIPAGSDIATMALPPDVTWRSPPGIPLHDDVLIEAVARFVPEECYYLRFGNWNNQLWLKRLMGEYGGDLTQMIALRGHSKADSQKMLDQIVIESSQLDDWFGGNLIEDVAAIGTDLYVEDGASNAILLLAKGDALQRQMESRRIQYAKDHAAEGVTLSELDITGHKVTLLATEDNRIRSFYAVHDLCHITSSSRKIVERFFEAADGTGSLAGNSEFREARRTLPLEHDHTVFIYLSRPFFQNVLGPRYQIELARRNRSLANIQLLQLAQWAAANEGYADDDIGKMIQHGFLPENYNRLPDGSESNWVDGAWHDSLRGLRGYYLPIADVPIEAITPAESAWLAERLAFFQKELREVDPLLLAFKRFDLGGDVERVVIDGRIAPFGKEKYGWIGDVLGPPLKVEIAGSPDDLITVQVSLSGNMFSRTDLPHQVFLAIQSDIPPKTDLQPTNFAEMLQLLKTTPGYLGAWPNPGYLDALPALGSPPDAEGFTYSRILDLWRLQYDDFALVSFDRNRLQAARGWIHVAPAERPAQVRLRVGDIANSNLRQWANVLYYERGWETSVANVRLLNLLIQQLRVPPETALAQVEQLLGLSLVCPLGGEYVMAPLNNGLPVWQSTTWPSFDRPQVPEDYVAPPMTWFRGLSLDVYQRDSQFVLHATLDIARGSSVAPDQESTGGGGLLNNLPGFNLFKGFSPVEDLPPGVESNNQSGELPGPEKTDKGNK